MLPTPALRPSLSWAGSSDDEEAREVAAAGADTPTRSSGAAVSAGAAAAEAVSAARTETHEAAEGQCIAPAGVSRSPVVRNSAATETATFSQRGDQGAGRTQAANGVGAHCLHVAAPPVPVPAAVLIGGDAAGAKRRTEALTAAAFVAPVFSTVNPSQITAYIGKTGPPKPALSTSASPVVAPTLNQTSGGSGRSEDSSACPSPLPIHGGEEAAANGAITGALQRAAARLLPPPSHPLASSSSPVAMSKNRESPGRDGRTGEQAVDGRVAAAPWLPELEREQQEAWSGRVQSQRSNKYDV